MSNIQVLPLPKVFPIWDHRHSMYPETIRVSFSNGKTVLYRIDIEQPAPQLKDALDDFTELCIGYERKEDDETALRD